MDFQYRGNVLKIHSVKKEDRGTYYCVADNGVGKAARRNVAVEVEFPPAVEGGGRIGQAMGYSVELVCHVEAYPRPTITWVHEGIQLSTNQVCRKRCRVYANILLAFCLCLFSSKNFYNLILPNSS